MPRKPLRLERRHFAFIADVVAQIDDPTTRKIVAELFTKKLASTNAQFNASRFLAACEPVRLTLTDVLRSYGDCLQRRARCSG